jgi:hypothetical protein
MKITPSQVLTFTGQQNTTLTPGANVSETTVVGLEPCCGTELTTKYLKVKFAVTLLTNFSANEDFFRCFSDSANEYGFG